MKFIVMLVLVASLYAQEKETAKELTVAQQEDVSRAIILVQSNQIAMKDLSIQIQELQNRQTTIKADLDKATADYLVIVQKLRAQLALPADCQITIDKKWIVQAADGKVSPCVGETVAKK